MIDDIYYLAHPWATHPTQSFNNAVAWTHQLREMGYYVFSPILHTHPYWRQLTDQNQLKYIGEEDWVEWDLKIMETMIPNVIILMSNTAYDFDDKNRLGWLSLGCRLEYYFAQEKKIKIYELESFFQGRILKINGGV